MSEWALTTASHLIQFVDSILQLSFQGATICLLTENDSICMQDIVPSRSHKYLCTTNSQGTKTRKTFLQGESSLGPPGSVICAWPSLSQACRPPHLQLAGQAGTGKTISTEVTVLPESLLGESVIFQLHLQDSSGVFRAPISPTRLLLTKSKQILQDSKVRTFLGGDTGSVSISKKTKHFENNCNCALSN